MDEKTYAHLFAYQVMLTTLAAYAKKNDPTFPALAQSHFDSFIGTLAGKDDAPHEMLVEARAAFADLLTSPRFDRQLTPTREKPLTWRRRFLNWLEQG